MAVSDTSEGNALKTLLIWGCGGHARSVSNVASNLGFKQIFFIDGLAKKGETINGFSAFSSIDKMLNITSVNKESCVAIASNGDPFLRVKQAKEILFEGLELTTVISTKASISETSKLSAGVFAGDFCHIGPRSIVYEGCILNTGSVVEHDSEIGAYSHISVSSSVCGSSVIGERVMLGAGATVIDGISIVADIVVGAGSCVVSDLNEKGVYVGVPASRLCHDQQ